MREKAKELQRQRMEAAKRVEKLHSEAVVALALMHIHPLLLLVIWQTLQMMLNLQPILLHSKSQKYGFLVFLNCQSYITYLKYFLIRKTSAPVRGMKLGGKGRDVESFVDQLKSEGENVISPTSNTKQAGTKAPAIKSDIDE